MMRSGTAQAGHHSFWDPENRATAHSASSENAVVKQNNNISLNRQKKHVIWHVFVFMTIRKYSCHKIKMQGWDFVYLPSFLYPPYRLHVSKTHRGLRQIIL